jgi:hypothetical protein
MDHLMDEVDEADLAVRKAHRKRQGLAAAKERLAAAKVQVAAIRHSTEHRQHMRELWQLLAHFPELILKYRDMKPFRGTAAEV